MSPWPPPPTHTPFSYVSTALCNYLWVHDNPLPPILPSVMLVLHCVITYDPPPHISGQLKYNLQRIIYKPKLSSSKMLPTFFHCQDHPSMLKNLLTHWVGSAVTLKLIFQPLPTYRFALCLGQPVELHSI